MAEQKEKKGGMGKLIIAIVVIAAVVVIAWQTGAIEFLSDIEAMQAWFNGLGAIGYAAYILVYIVMAVFLLPASVITIVAGLVFGSIVGGILALIGATIGASVAFIVAKYVARDMVTSKFQGNAIFKRIEDGVARDGASFLILTRLVPIFPYNVQNYAYGVTSMKLGTFALVSLITMAPGAFIYAFLAGEIATNGVSVTLLIQFAAAGLILFLISLIPKAIAKKKGIDISK